jgi:PAS domain S-box-containing protein
MKWIERFLPTRLQQNLRERFWQFIHEGKREPVFHDSPVITRTGEERMIAWHSVSLMDGLGRIVGTLSSGDDVTERYQAEADQRRLAAIVESSDAAIVGKSLDGTVTNWNKAAEKIFGYTAGEMVGQHISVLATPDRHDELKTILEQARRGIPVSQFESQRRRKDGRVIPVLVSVSPIWDAAGRIVGVSKIANDISELQHARAEREALVADLRKTQERLLAAQRISRMGHWEYDPSNSHLWWSDRIFEME